MNEKLDILAKENALLTAACRMLTLKLKRLSDNSFLTEEDYKKSGISPQEFIEWWKKRQENDKNSLDAFENIECFSE